MSEVDRSHLPIRRPTFSGAVNRTLDGSQPDWNLIGHPTPPEGAPNVLLVLIDDAGFGNPSTFGGPIQTPNYTRIARGRRALQPVPRHRAVLADPGRAADRTEQPHGGLRLGRRVRGRVPGLLGDPAPRLRAAAPDPQGQRLQHRRLREVAPHARRPAGSRGPVRPVAQRVGLRLLLRVPRRRREPVGPVPGREPEDHRHARRSTTTRSDPYYFPDAMADRTHRVVARDPRPGRAQALLRCTSRPAAATPRTTSRRSGPTSTRGSSTRGGTSSARRRSPARRSSA